MQPEGLPISSQSIVGYMLYLVAQGQSLEVAYQRAKIHPDFGDQALPVFIQARTYAEAALEALAAIRAGQETANFRPGSLPIPFLGPILGLRLSYAYTDTTGITRESSVVINVGPHTTMQELRQVVEEIAYGGIARGTNYSPLPAVALTDPEIYQAMPGGYASALRTLA